MPELDSMLESELITGSGVKPRRRRTTGGFDEEPDLGGDGGLGEYSAPPLKPSATAVGRNPPPAISTSTIQSANTGLPSSNNTGIAGGGTPPSQSPQPYAGGDAREWIMSLLGGGNTSERRLAELAPTIDAAFGPGSVQMAGDNTARGRLHNIPGYGMVTVVGDQQGFGDGPWAWRTGNEQFGSGDGGGAPAGGGAGGGLQSTVLDDYIKQMLAKSSKDDEFDAAVRTGILDDINRNTAPVDENDPTMAAQRRAYSSEQDRSMAQNREVLAARGAAQGYGTGALDAGVTGLLESGMDAKSSNNAQMMADRYSQQLESLNAALNRGAGILNADETRELQASIAAIEAEMQKLGLQMNDSHFYDDLGFRIGSQQSSVDSQLLNMLLNG